MNPDDQIEKAELDISVFEIPPAAAYFETMQQLQKVNAKLEILLRIQCEIMARLNDGDVEAEVKETKRKVAELYEKLLLRYFESADIDRDALRNSIDPHDRAGDDEGKSFQHTRIV